MSRMNYERARHRDRMDHAQQAYRASNPPPITQPQYELIQRLFEEREHDLVWDELNPQHMTCGQARVLIQKLMKCERKPRPKPE